MVCNLDLELRRGGFNVPLEALETAGIIRAMNVSREYPEEPPLGRMAELGYLLRWHATDDPPVR